MFKMHVSEYAGKYAIVNTRLFDEGWTNGEYLVFFISSTELLFVNLYSNSSVQGFKEKVKDFKDRNISKGKKVRDLVEPKLRIVNKRVGFPLISEAKSHNTFFVGYGIKSGNAVGELALSLRLYTKEQILNQVTPGYHSWISDVYDLYTGNVEYMLETSL